MPFAPVPARPKKPEVNKPSVPLKAFFWDKLRDNELKDGVLWTELGKEDEKLSPDLLKLLESRFEAKKLETGGSDQAKVQVDNKPKFISVLEAKKT